MLEKIVIIIITIIVIVIMIATSVRGKTLIRHKPCYNPNSLTDACRPYIRPKPRLLACLKPLKSLNENAFCTNSDRSLYASSLDESFRAQK